MIGEWRVLIADDEPLARRGVTQLLSAFPEFRIVGECRNGDEVLTALDSLQPHVVFLDIQMPGAGGFDVIRRRTAARMPTFVFLTAFDEFAVRAFDAQALDYLVKPVSVQRFQQTIARLLRHLHAQRALAPEPRIVVPTARGERVFALGDIDWIESADNYARLWVGDRSYLVRESLVDLEARTRTHGFIRVHRRALVPVARAKLLTRTARGESVLVLRSGAKIPVSRRRRAKVHAAMRRGTI
jgi:two-component system LytT family response regulator